MSASLVGSEMCIRDRRRTEEQRRRRSRPGRGADIHHRNRAGGLNAPNAASRNAPGNPARGSA
eukprot:130269-Alexandrium_andersonii.AAC.1